MTEWSAGGDGAYVRRPVVHTYFEEGMLIGGEGVDRDGVKDLLEEWRNAWHAAVRFNGLDLFDLTLISDFSID